MVQQCSENQYLWEHFTVYMCVERLNSFGARPIVLCKILLKQSCWTLSNIRCRNHVILAYWDEVQETNSRTRSLAHFVPKKSA
jgi:hypothetical protein